MNRYIYTTLILCIGLNCSLKAQDSLAHFYLSDTAVLVDQQVCVSVRVNNFDSVEAFQMSFNFDPYLLDFDSIGRMNQEIGLNVGFFGLQERHIGIIRLAFFDPFEAHTLADSSILFDLCFTAYGLPDELCPVNIADFPFPLEVISKEEVVPSSRRDAIIDIRPNAELTLFTSTCKTGIDDTTGSLSVTAYGGNPPYFVIWQHTFNSNFSGGFGLDTFGDTKVINDLIEGRYRITITDEDGMRLRDSLNLRKANDLVYSTTLIQPRCDNTPEGAIIIDSIQGGIVPAQFKWSDGHLFSKQRHDLSVGDYYLTITNPLGCRILDTFVLEANSIQASVLAIDETCLEAGDGRFVIDVAGGDPFDSVGYQIIYQSDTTYGINLSDSMLATGKYEIQVSDSIGCIKFVEATIGTGLSFTAAQLEVDQVSCFGDSSASIFLRPTTLTGMEIFPYSFSWTGTDSATIDSASILLDNLGIGTYTITVENAAVSGCSWDTTVIINQPPFLSVSTSSIVPASCIPGLDGQATIQIVGGSPDGDGDYFISWRNGGDSITGIDLDTGIQQVTVIDLEGCRRVHEVEIPTTNPPIIIGSSIRDFSCDSMATGSILTVFSSPFGIESYNWSTGATTSSIKDLLPGTYSCKVTDRNGCVDTFVFDAPAPQGPVISDLIVQNIRCLGDTNGRLDVVFSLDTLGNGLLDRLEWNTGAIGDSLINLRSGGYKIIIYDQNGCVDSAATTLVEPELISATYSTMADTNFNNTGEISADVDGGWSPYQFMWSPGILPDSSVIDNLAAGEYYLVLTDREGCQFLDTIVIDFISATINQGINQEYSIYPIPTRDEVFIHNKLHGASIKGPIYIYNQMGLNIGVQESVEVNGFSQISLKNYPAGMYLLTNINDGKVINLGFVVKE